MGLKNSSCAEGCESCLVAAAAPREPGPYAGWRLGVVSLGYFITPIVTAFVGARLGAPGHGAQALGAILGLAAGMGAAIFVARRVGRDRPDRARSSHRPGDDIHGRMG